MEGVDYKKDGGKVMMKGILGGMIKGRGRGER